MLTAKRTAADRFTLHFSTDLYGDAPRFDCELEVLDGLADDTLEEARGEILTGLRNVAWARAQELGINLIRFAAIKAVIVRECSPGFVADLFVTDLIR